MDAYSKVIAGNQLYPLDVIEQMGKRHPKWHSMGGREKEHTLLHIMLCMLLCNRERINLKQVSLKRKGNELLSEKTKILKLSTSHSSFSEPSTSTAPHHAHLESQSTSTSTTETTEDEMMEEMQFDADIQDFRFKMINHMPMKDATQKEICDTWGIPELSHQWDVVDVEEEKLIRVRYSYNIGSDVHKYLTAKSEIPKNSDMFIIAAGEVTGKWIDGNRPAKGEQKIAKFLLERKLILESQGINDNLYLPPVDMANLFPSEWIKGEMAKWEEDLLKDQYQQYTEKELYMTENPPKTITPSDLLKYLEPCNEGQDSSSCVKWKGKLMPEPFCFNIQTQERLDADIISLLLSTIEIEMAKGYTVTNYNMKSTSVLCEDTLINIIKIWQESDRNTFSFMEHANRNLCQPIKEALGINRKGVIHAVYHESMKQPEYSQNDKLCYSPWVEEVITGLGEDSNVPLGYLACPELLTMSPTDGHPIPTLCEPVVTEVLDGILSTNVGVQISKLTNTYSRLGGAYGNGEIYGKEMFKNIAIFPVMATLSYRDNPTREEEGRSRLVSGAVIRAPYHARRPTDRIMMITIELVRKNETTREFFNYVRNCQVIETCGFFIAVRQNAVMKEDSTYNSFITTSLFTPINMLGCLTMENPGIRRDENMKTLIERTLDSGKEWFIERAIEGTLFSMIGNARDEGYFACLRKLFLVILTWRKEKASASLDIETFCRKANECLIDNPISMYFHRTLLYIINIYKRRGARIAQ
uniref:Polymerase PA n=1 Tax=Lepidopteran orthomyxo-related virus OKIAV1731 TaxID=2746277 RepID=A0A7D7JQ98_9ORTO|nr:polymerase PA [Lepidopteran orthomyxo-related virus OKIAV1731]